MRRSQGRHPGRLAGLFGFLAPESLRPDPRLALRGVLGLMAPVLLGRALGLPALDFVGIAAFLLTFGDATGPEEPRQLTRLALGAALGAVALASGVIAGSHIVTAIAGMLVWGAVAGLLGAYGNAGAAMGLPVAWAYLALGLSAPIHTPWQASGMAALYLGGGVWAMILASIINVLGPYGPLRERTAECYAALAGYFETVLRAPAQKPAGPALAPETRVRVAIASARLLAARTRQNQQATSEVGRRLQALIELADRLFSLGAALGDQLAASAVASEAVVTEAVHGIPAIIRGRAKAGAAQSLLGRLDHLVDQEANDEASRLRGRLAGAASSALHLAAGDASVPMMTVGITKNRRIPRHLVEPLRACLAWNSLVLRHALRFAVLTAAAVLVQLLWHPPFGYWIPLTVTVVLKPYAGTTLTRGAQRLSGTLGGVLVGLVISALMMGGWAAQAVVTAAAFFLLLAVLPINYAWAVFFLSAGIIPLEAMLTGGVDWQTGLFRIVNTGAGGAMALAGSLLLWPAYEAGSLLPMTAATVGAMARYAASLMGAPVAEATLEQTHREAGLMNSNLQAVFQRTIRETAREPERFQTTLLAVATLQSLLLGLNTLRVVGVGPELAAAEGQRFASEVVATLERLGAALDARTRPASARALDEALHALHRVVARSAGGASLRAIALVRVGQEVLLLHDGAGRLAAACDQADQNLV